MDLKEQIRNKVVAKFAYQGDVDTAVCISVAEELTTLFQTYLEEQLEGKTS